MAVCDNKPWDMSLFIDPSSPIARPLFREVMIKDGKITGKVHMPIGHVVSDLVGACEPLDDLGLPGASLMSFVFRLRDSGGEIGIFMSGIGCPLPASTQILFNGKWVAFAPAADTPEAGEQAEEGLIIPGSGDTGTGTGSQT